MKRWIMAGVAAVLMCCTATGALAASDQQQKIDDAITVVRQFVDIPENAIPPTLLRQAHGIAIIPSVVKLGLVFGGRHGNGVLSVRTPDGSWSNPSFISLSGASIGWQIGLSSTDIVLVFKTQRSIDRIARGQVSLGGDVAVAAGPVGRSASASTNLAFDAEVYSYSRARGLFAGVSIEGGHIGIDEHANWLFYDQAGLDADTILRSTDASMMPQPGPRFVALLDRYMPPADSAPDDRVPRSDNAAGAATANDARPGGTGNGQAVPYEQRSGVTVQRRGGTDNANPTARTGPSDRPDRRQTPAADREPANDSDYGNPSNYGSPR